MDEREATGRGGGKVILFGEHAVVFGEPAVVAGLPEGAEATAMYTDDVSQLRVVNPPGEFELELSGAREGYESWWRAYQAGLSVFDDYLEGPVAVDVRVDIPIGVGLGSSAALGTAVARALADLTGESGPVDEAVEASERVFHGEPSGIDQLAAKHGGVRFFRRDEPEAPAFDIPPLELVVCEAGEAAATAGMVEGVRALEQREPALVNHVLTWIGDISRKASEALREGALERVGELMNLNHGALVSLGVSTRELDAACHVAREHGAHGAKLTGAGGGGCVIAVVSQGESDAVLSAWKNEGFRGFSVTLGDDD